MTADPNGQIIAFKPTQVSGSWPSPDIVHFWRYQLRPSIRRGEGQCSLCARMLERRGDDPVQVILCAMPEPAQSVGIVAICNRCGDDDWNCSKPEALTKALLAAAALDDAETRH